MIEPYDQYLEDQKEMFNHWLALVMKKAGIDILTIEEIDVKNIENYKCSCIYDKYTKAWIFKR